MKQLYETPTLMDYGAIAESTFGHPRRHHWHYDLDDEGSSGLPEVFPTRRAAHARSCWSWSPFDFVM